LPPEALKGMDSHTGDLIPASHTCDGRDTSPELRWSQTPPETRSFVLIMDDPDAPNGTFTHWILFDVPSSVEGLSAGEEHIGIPGRNDFQHAGYKGPCPPPRRGEHRYFFQLYALDIESLSLARGATRAEVERAMRGHILDRTEFMGRYERR
jgi:Raf kinase inhibitor-like YbhB/YbcL family protein